MLNLGPCPNNNSSATGLESVSNALHTVNNTACREIWTFNILQQLICCYVIIVDICHCSVDNLTEIMWRHVCSHTNSNTRSSVNQKQRYLRWQYRRLFQIGIEVRLHINYILLYIGQRLFGDLLQTSLRIPHSSRTIAVD